MKEEKVYLTLQNGQVFEGKRFGARGDVIGELVFTVLDTPGHTPGGISLYYPAENAVFTGDALFFRSIGRTDFPGGSIKKIMASLRRLGQLEGDLRVLPGHMEPSTLDRERRTNPFLIQAMR